MPPIHEFECPGCGKTKEEICRKDELPVCYRCQVPMKKLMSAPTLGIGKRHLKKGRMPAELKEYNQ